MDGDPVHPLDARDWLSRRPSSWIPPWMDTGRIPMTESPTERITRASCGPAPRGAWVCLPQHCNRDEGMCPERLVWELHKD